MRALVELLVLEFDNCRVVGLFVELLVSAGCRVVGAGCRLVELLV